MIYRFGVGDKDPVVLLDLVQIEEIDIFADKVSNKTMVTFHFKGGRKSLLSYDGIDPVGIDRLAKAFADSRKV